MDWARQIKKTNAAASTGYATVTDIALNLSNDLFVYGQFTCQVDTDPGSGETAHGTCGRTGSDVFFGKYNSSGNLSLSEFKGFIGDEDARKTAIDSDNNFYAIISSSLYAYDVDFELSWIFSSATLRDVIVDGSNNLYVAGDNYLAKLNRGTGAVIWSKTLDGAEAKGLAVNASYVYITGTFSGSSTIGTPNLLNASSGAMFVARFDASTGNNGLNGQVSGNSSSGGSAIGVDASGNVYATGISTSEGCIAKFNSNLSTQSWAVNLGSNIFCNDLTVNSGLIYIAGYYTSSSANFNPKTGGQSLNLSNTGGFFARYNENGFCVAATGITKSGGSSDDVRVNSIVVNGSNIYVGGQFQGTATFDNCTGSTMTSDPSNNKNGFFAKYTIPDFAVTGNDLACKNTSETYTLSSTPASGGTQSWFRPSGWTITSGQGTNQITATIGTNGNSGNVGDKITYSCFNTVIQPYLYVATRTCRGLRVAVYPNPADGKELTVSAIKEGVEETAILTGESIDSESKFEIKLFDKNQKFMGAVKSEKGVAKLKIDEIKEGNYFLKIDNGVEIIEKQVVINK